MEGFFSGLELPTVREPPSLVARCGACGLYKNCHSPKMVVSGKGRRKIMLIGEAPGEQEDERGRQFVGDSGQKLRAVLRKVGLDPDNDCWFHNSLSCRPPKNRTPSDAEIEYCRPLVLKAINELQPNVIVLLGGSPARSVIGHLWREDVGGISTLAGWRIPGRKPNAWICPTYHPAYLLRMNDPVLELDFEEHLRAAAAFVAPPWRNPPDWRKRVQIIHDPEEARKHLVMFIAFGRPVSFDYETDRLKPDHPDAHIVCASVSDGDTTIAFPWAGAAVDEMKILLQSKIPKYGFNAKFETRWTRRILRVDVKNWAWDGMLAAHILDNRARITSLKFQLFVNFGQEDYASHIKPYLEGMGGSGRNRINEVPLDDLLLYCGIDSYGEHRLAQLQMGYMKNGGLCR
jgi:uracil-DNA glycosylase family 4